MTGWSTLDRARGKAEEVAQRRKVAGCLAIVDGCAGRAAARQTKPAAQCSVQLTLYTAVKATHLSYRAGRQATHWIQEEGTPTAAPSRVALLPACKTALKHLTFYCLCDLCVQELAWLPSG